MNTNVGLIGKKLGNTQVFNDDGSVARVTVIQVGPCRVIGKRTLDKDGYSAVILGFGEKREKLLTKAEAGLFKKLGQAPVRTLREFRLAPEVVAKYEVGQELKPSEYFSEGQKVDVSGTTIGKGYAGVIKRYHFSSNRASHGNSLSHNSPGSIGMAQDPGRVFPGKRMSGHLGDVKRTVQLLEVARVDAERSLLLIKGSVPGPKNAPVIVRPSVKAKAKAAPAKGGK